jgi:hypothetical protein
VGITKTYRFRNYDIREDLMTETTYAAECISGDEADCGAQSSDEIETVKVERWIAEHVRDTGHERLKRVATTYATAAPGEWQ